METEGRESLGQLASVGVLFLLFAFGVGSPSTSGLPDPVPGREPFSTFVGGLSADYAYAIAVDAEGSILIAGQTGSIDLPDGIVSAIQNLSGPTDGFVLKLNATGDMVIMSATRFWSAFVQVQFLMSVAASPPVLLNSVRMNLRSGVSG